MADESAMCEVTTTVHCQLPKGHKRAHHQTLGIAVWDDAEQPEDAAPSMGVADEIRLHLETWHVNPATKELLKKLAAYHTQQAYDPMLVVHIDSSTTKTHPVDQPCATCRPPITVTAEMVDRAVAAFCDRKLVNKFAPAMTDSMRSALEAALNYQP